MCFLCAHPHSLSWTPYFFLLISPLTLEVLRSPSQGFGFKSTGFLTPLLVVDSDLGHWVETGFSEFVHCEVTFFSVFPYWTLWKEITRHNPHLGRDVLCFPEGWVTYRNYLRFVCRRNLYFSSGFFLGVVGWFFETWFSCIALAVLELSL